MTVSSSDWKGLKEFGNGDATLFDGNILINELNESDLDLRDDFEYEFHRLLTDTNTSTFSSLDSSTTDGLYSTPPETIHYETNNEFNSVKFEEDPLSAILNIEQCQQNQIPQPLKVKKRGRPPLIKFKPTTEYIHNKPIMSQQINTDITCNNTQLIQQQKFELRERRSNEDFYSPVWIRGKGIEREGLCPLCAPPHWFKIKQSAYWYHLNFYHGISAATGKPYKRPLSFRLIPSAGNSQKVEGHCGNCLQWIVLCSDFKGSDVEENVSFTNWYKHAQKCHYRTKEFRIPF